MVGVAWLIAIIALLGLAQFAVYRYAEGREGAPIDQYAVDGPPYAPVRAATAAGEGEAEGRRCGRCGAINEPDYTFCRECTGRLGA